MSQAPPFANDTVCKSCQVKYNLITRRHHCRNCGGSFCNDCCGNRDILSHYGLTTPERTCDACHKYLRSVNPVAAEASFDIPDKLSVIGGHQSLKPEEKPPFIGFSPFPNWQNGGVGECEYEGSPEDQLRDAIKQNDLRTIDRLIKAKADPCYIDRTGNTLLHLACVLDRYPIVKLLCEAKGNPYVYNTLTKPENAYDVSSAALQIKIRTNYPPESYNLSADLVTTSRRSKKRSD